MQIPSLQVPEVQPSQEKLMAARSWNRGRKSSCELAAGATKSGRASQEGAPQSGGMSSCELAAAKSGRASQESLMQQQPRGAVDARSGRASQESLMQQQPVGALGARSSGLEEGGALERDSPPRVSMFQHVQQGRPHHQQRPVSPQVCTPLLHALLASKFWLPKLAFCGINLQAV